MPESETRAAFIIAALVLLVMPIVYVIGLAGAMLIVQLTSWREASGAIFVFAVLWGVVVLAGILSAARQIHRRSVRL
jgi:hypothetical protein